MDKTTTEQVRTITRALYDGFIFVNDELDADEYQDDHGAIRLFLTMPASFEYETKSQYGFIALAAHPDGSLEIILEGLLRSGRKVRLEATAPSFTITEKQVNPADFPGSGPTDEEEEEEDE